MDGTCDYAEAEWACVRPAGHDGPHWSAPPPVRWHTNERGLRTYEVDGHAVDESSRADTPHLWIDGTLVTLEAAAAIRDTLPDGPWRETLSTAIERHYQVREPKPDWKAGDPCELCGSTDTTLDEGAAACAGCGATEAPAPTAEPAPKPVPYDREVLVNVLVYHWPTPTSGCRCGWNLLGASHPEHVADVYEQSVAAKTTESGA